MLVRIKGDIQVRVPDSIRCMTTYVLLEQEDWFEDEIRFLRRAVSPGMQVVDVGANHGVYALTCARQVTDSGRVWAFEPSTATAGYLAESISVNGFENTRLVRAALSDRTGEARLNIFPDSEANSLVSTAGSTGAETVALTTLDDCAEKYGWRDIDFLKLDAEGEEQRIISGGRRLLEASSPLVMFELRHGRDVNHALVDQFRSLGYAPYRLLPGLHVLSPLEPREQHDDYLLNVFCCKPDRAEKLQQQGLLAIDRAVPLDKSCLERAHWRPCLGGKAYSGTFQSAWRKFPSKGGRAGGGRYARGLGMYCLAHSDSMPAALRVACLERARALVSEACGLDPSPGRAQSHARILWELGHRQQALEVMRNLLQQLVPGSGVDADEPFLPANPRFDGLPVAGKQRAEAWFLSGLVEQLEKLSVYSSFFVRDPVVLKSMIERLDFLRANDFMSVGMERRRCLAGILNALPGIADCPEVLKNAAADHLNAPLWESGAITAA